MTVFVGLKGKRGNAQWFQKGEKKSLRKRRDGRLSRLEKRVGKGLLGVAQLKCFLQMTRDFYMAQNIFAETHNRIKRERG